MLSVFSFLLFLDSTCLVMQHKILFVSFFQNDGDGLVGESPYIGKGRFKHQEHARPPSQPQGLTQMDIDRDMMERMHEALDRELAEKQDAIDKGELLKEVLWFILVICTVFLLWEFL